MKKCKGLRNFFFQIPYFDLSFHQKSHSRQALNPYIINYSHIRNFQI